MKKKNAIALKEKHVQSVPCYFQGFHFPFGQRNINFKVKNCGHFDNFFFSLVMC